MVVKCHGDLVQNSGPASGEKLDKHQWTLGGLPGIRPETNYYLTNVKYIIIVIVIYHTNNLFPLDIIIIGCRLMSPNNRNWSTFTNT